MKENLNIPESFKRFRTEFNLTKSDLAKALGIAYQSYGLENPEKSNNPTAKTLFKIAKLYNVSTDYLLGLTDDPRPVNQILNQMLNRTEIAMQKKEISQLKNKLDAIKNILNST